MKISKISLSLTLIMSLLVGMSASGAASAAWDGHGGGHGGGRWHGGARVGIYVGAPIRFNYGYYPYSYYGAPFYGTPYYSSAPAYYPPVQSAPMIYTERSDIPQINSHEAPINSAQVAQGDWWYFCADAKAYYPYVNQCPEGWLRVAPQSPPDSGNQPVLNSSPAT
jgi:hypothetical protein